MKKQTILLICAVLLVGVGALVYLGQRNIRAQEIYYSGTIEAIVSDLAFQVTGRVRKIYVDEGQWVEKGLLLADIDDSEYQARYDQALANLAGSEETFKQARIIYELNRKILPTEVKRSEASVKALKAQLKEAEIGYRPEETAQARLIMDSAEAVMKESRSEKDRYDRLFERKIVAKQDKDKIDLRYETSVKDYERTKEAYLLSRSGFRKETIEVARARFYEGLAVLQQAKNNLSKIESAKQDVEVAKEIIKANKAAVSLARTQLSHTHLIAPFSGIILSRNVEPGEVVTAGREVLSVSDISRVDLKIFVDETEIGHLKPGRKVKVKIDTFPDKDYFGWVAYISPEAEFTPKIIQTHKERVKLVYLVKVALPNPEKELKPGMPADAWFLDNE
ncbi:MAG: efflux RND transporter periplasmic adaptor subunit [Desulfobacterales bacterium]|nr:efflux RND transporter periplasmic adaptor subunit [Desulfobacterales bacterium]